MALMMAGIGLRGLMERQMAKRKRTPIEYVVPATIGFFIAAIIKYPNRAFLSRARPDLKARGQDAPGHPLIGNLADRIRHRDNLPLFLHKVFQEQGDVM
jgi:hypothetical protein